ncbi:helix-turn-helix domain-containing protein [Chryseobacterium oryzae]|uniref:AraC family transcriptional regulator n=1 Tax=Chryseobacterium oryzae TaxID=2929799 RepID=A0ABY4BK56_9FLAO|nr:AraC family transcriptional regulator [Chryseobacterium oryzae]UOE39567.1 AraC family transcriptional regulator [Chryseobacterium oryzae]
MRDSNNDLLKRGQEITENYFRFLDGHIEDVVSGKIDEFMEINAIADALFISHKHLTDTLQQETGHHPCYFYDDKIIEKAKDLLLNSEQSVSEIAKLLTYDPSNFSKFFKKFTGQTPGEFRKIQKK